MKPEYTVQQIKNAIERPRYRWLDADFACAKHYLDVALRHRLNSGAPKIWASETERRADKQRTYRAKKKREKNLENNKNSLDKPEIDAVISS